MLLGQILCVVVIAAHIWFMWALYTAPLMDDERGDTHFMEETNCVKDDNHCCVVRMPCRLQDNTYKINTGTCCKQPKC